MKLMYVFILTILSLLHSQSYAQLFEGAENALNEALNQSKKASLVPIETPEHYGAVGNDGEDDTEALKQLFTNPKGIIMIPAKQYLLSETLVIGRKQAYCVMGTGMSLSWVAPGHSLEGPSARITWIGEPGGTMLEYHGSGLVWQGVKLEGLKHKNQGDDARAGVGLAVRKVGAGLGTGKLYVPNICIYGCKYGVTMGDEDQPRGANCDVSVWGFCQIERADVAFRMHNEQSMGHYFQYFQPRSCKVGIEALKGGHVIVCGGLSVSTGTLLKLGEGPGSNNSIFSFKGYKIDAKNSNLKLVHMTTRCPVTISFEDCHQSGQPDQSGNFELVGHATVTIRNSNGLVGKHSFLLKKSAFQGRDLKPNILLDRCRITNDGWRHPDSDTMPVWARINGCFLWDGTPVPDVTLGNVN